MINELGLYSSIFSLVIALLICCLPMAAFVFNMVNKQRQPFVEIGCPGALYNPISFYLLKLVRPLSILVFCALMLSFVCLVNVFLNDDFSNKYAVGHSNSFLPWYYKVSAVWGGHEGSLLLWVLILCGWTAVVAYASKSLPIHFSSIVLAVLASIEVGFILFTVLTSNPFERVVPLFPVDGGDLNPLLQDLGLIIHPPMLYLGYVGFAVAFAFAVAGLILGKLDMVWARWTRPWTTAAWMFLTLGIALGSWWAYYELGWGGWWFWDPVENASFMPWLCGTALIHSLAVTEKRQTLKAWTLLLCILCFSLSLLGTFLVRSGVLTSVHAFASDPKRGVFILLLLVFFVGSALTLFCVRYSKIQSKNSFQFFAREFYIFLNNIFMGLATAIVLCGTLYPLLTQVFDIGQYSVGEGYFNTFFVPLAWVMLIVLVPGFWSGWKQHVISAQYKKALVIACLSAFLSTFIAVHTVLLSFNLKTTISIFLSSILVCMIAFDILFKAQKSKSNIVQGLRKISISYYAMHLAHFGFVIALLGVSLVATQEVENNLVLKPGDSYQSKGYQITLNSVKNVVGANYDAIQGEFLVENGNDAFTLYPEKRFYWSGHSVMTEAAIDAGLTRDIYIALGDEIKADASQSNTELSSWAVRFYIKPYIRFIWLGAVCMFFAGFMVLLDKRYRLKLT